MIDVDDIIQESDGHLDCGRKTRPVNRTDSILPTHEYAKIDGAQVTGFVWKKRYFTAGVGCLDKPERRCRVCRVDGVQENEARVTGLPGTGDDVVPQLLCLHQPDHFFCAGMAQRPFPILFQRQQESIWDADGNIETGEYAFLLLAAYELFDVRVIHIEDAHISPPPLSPLLDLFGGSIEHLHERNGTGGHSPCRGDQVVLRP